MAKHRIQNYVFLPGVAKSSNAYPNAYTLLQQNKEFIKAEAVAYVDQQILLDNSSNLYPNAVNLLTNNKQFLIDEIIAWIKVRYTRTVTSTATTGFITVSSAHFYSVGDPVVFASSVGGLSSGTTYYVSEVGAGDSPTTFKVTATKGSTTNVTLSSTSGQSVQVSYTYSESSCRRDSGYLIDAIIYDVKYGGNEKTIDIAKNFWQGGALQLYTPAIEIAGFNQIFTIITSNILPKVSYSSQQNPVTSTQNTTGSASESDVATNITNNLKPIISNAISSGLSSLPAISYSIKNFAGYIYDSTKCYRDIGYVIDAYLNDLRYGGNAEIRFVSSRFWKDETPQLSGDRRPEIVTQQWISNLITDVIMTQTSYTPLQTNVLRYTNNSITAEPNGIARIPVLSTILTDTIQNGLSSLPTLVNGVTTIRLQGKINLDTILLVTNTSKNEILYNFSDNTTPIDVIQSTGYVSNDYWQDDDYKSFRDIVDWVTTVKFDYDTSTHLVSDDIQFFIDQKEMRVRPYDFGTDAIERHRVAQAQSMLDADFEYGLQPTKWQAIGISRGYPSVYEVPGTDTAVSNVTTDASTGTSGIGQSLITVTTVGPHNLTVGTPITIKALANSVSGFSRAEGTFIVNTVPSAITFTYYAQSKVGTSNGQVLATTYTQLRKAAFYTGSSIGQPSFSVLSNGQSVSFNSKYITSLGTDQLAFTGTAPAIGAALTASGIPSGTQVTGVVGSGGLIVSKTVQTSASIGATALTLTNTTSILEGMAIDNGSGESIFISGIIGNVINLTGPITLAKTGDVQTYTNLSGTNVNPTGNGAIFSVSKDSASYTNLIITTAGGNYRNGDRIIISGTNLGGSSPANNLTITVTSVDGSGGITTASISGTAFTTDTTYNSISGANQVPTGTGAIFSISVSGGAYTNLVITTSGSGYLVNNIINIPGDQLGGVSPSNNLKITVTGINGSGGITSATISGTATGADTTYTNLTGTNVSGIGSGLTVNITTDSGSYSNITVAAGGTNYLVNDKIKIFGTNLGGISPDNDLVITITSTNAGGSVADISYTGTAFNSDATYTSRTGTIVNPIGTGAIFNITRNNGLYSATIVSGGSNYVSSERIKILGTSLGGTTPANDLTITISSVSNGSISNTTSTGTAITGSTVDFYSTITLSDLTTASIPDNTTITGGAIALIEVSFNTAHGLVPGASIIADISSTGSNHGLARGPFFIEQVPTSKTLRYTARTTGTIDTATALTGTLYTRPDSYFIHRPYDGGVQLSTGGPQHGAQAIRMSKKYIRYQSGKGVNYCTGALFAPSFAIQSISATGTAIGSYITITTDDVDHGCQVGGIIEIHGIETKGYNNTYTVADIINERQLRVQAISVLANVTGTLSIESLMSVKNWHGAVVRAGTFDDQNGLYFYYDGRTFGVGKRSATFQIAGTINIAKDTNLISGTNTRFRDQVHAGDRIVIKGMTHVVTNVISQTEMTVNPDYRGFNNAVQAKICLVQDYLIPQNQFNIDKLDGTGPSGFNIDITKMQMIGMQWSWYAVGFIDFMLRGSDGNFIFFHRIRNSNVNTEAYMRTGNQPVRYEVINEGAKDKLRESISSTATVVPLSNASEFPNEAGFVMIDNELISFTGKSGNNLTGCTRSAPMTNFVGGSQRTFTGSIAATHEFNTGVILVSNTISPIISHWGSAMLTDGNFDEDRGYIFSYAATNVAVSTTKQTAFLIRLAPSVSNAIVGDLGDRELLNRAQLLLKGIEITADTGTGGLVIEGVLNPQNYPTDPSLLGWTGLQSSAQGGQPSFAQIAPGGSVTWSSGATQTTTAVTTQAFPTGTITAKAGFSGSSLFSGSTYFIVLENDYQTYVSSGFAVGDRITGTGIPANTTISSIGSTFRDSGTNYRYIYLSQTATQTVSGDSSLTVTKSYPLSSTSQIFLQKASFENSGARAGTEVSDPLFPSNTFVSSATLLTYFGTQYYRVTFNQTSSSTTTITAGTTTVTFKFGQPPYALPGETVFSFIAAPGSSSELDLSELKELTNTTLGGRGCYPNGPDVLAINVYKASGSAINANIVLRWSEAQA